MAHAKNELSSFVVVKYLRLAVEVDVVDVAIGRKGGIFPTSDRHI